jgi:electron transport complex protein RnfC
MMALFARKKTFAHGVHPPEAKGDTSALPIRAFAFAPSVTVPLSQHIGRPAVAIVRPGQEVVRGQRIGAPDGFLSVAMHAPVSGVVRAVGPVPNVQGRMVDGIQIEAFPGSTQEVMDGTPCDPLAASPDQVLAAIQEAGIVGLGGAGFPTHAKLRVPDGKRCDVLLINGVECEPYLTTDHRVMLEHPADVMVGIRYLLRVTGAGRVILAVEANKIDAAEALRRAVPDDLPVEVVVLPVKYPQGAEKMLIAALLDREVPSGGLPIDVGAICCNVATTAEIGQLLPRGRGIQERIITVGGPGVIAKGNYRITVGTPLRFVLDTVKTRADVTRVFLGGPMMGQAVSSLDIPVTKGTTGIIALTEAETGVQGARREYPCIRCGSCLDACPLFLNPSALGALAKKGRYAEMASEHHLMDCFECGSCTFVCPAHIPLVHHFRVAKQSVRRTEARARG